MRLFPLLGLTFLYCVSAFPDETEQQTSKQEIITREQQGKEQMTLVLSHYLEMLPQKRREDIQTQQQIWSRKRTTYCHSRKKFEDFHLCLITEYRSRSKALDELLAARLEELGLDYRMPQFPVHAKDGEDEFDMKKIEHSDYSFSFSTTWANGHMCGGEGIAKKNGKIFERIPDSKEVLLNIYPGIRDEESFNDANQENINCTLTIEFSPHYVKFKGNACNNYFACGTRAAAEGELFRSDSFATDGYKSLVTTSEHKK